MKPKITIEMDDNKIIIHRETKGHFGGKSQVTIMAEVVEIVFGSPGTDPVKMRANVTECDL